MFPNVIFFGLIQEVFVQYHVRTRRRYGNNCCVCYQT